LWENFKLVWEQLGIMEEKTSLENDDWLEKQEEIAELLNGRDDVVSSDWMHGMMEVYITFTQSSLVGRNFVEQMENVGMKVVFVDIATDRIGFGVD
jgi:hypothetical protein